MRLRTIVGALSFSALVVAPQVAEASSHREAPFVSKNPKDDGTDLYAFESYETGRTGFVTILANYQPLQDAYGGPNYFGMDPDALYEIMIDNNGDGVEDITFQFQFKTALGGASNAGFALSIGPSTAAKTVAVPFYNVGLIPDMTDGTGGNSAALNVLETYSVNMVTGPRRTGTSAPVPNPKGGDSFNKPADNVGVKSFGTTGPGVGTGTTVPIPASGGGSDYAAYANTFIYNNVVIPGCATTGSRIFVGQRAEGFAVNLGPTFDLIDAPAAVVTSGGTDFGVVPDPLLNKNVSTIAIEIPRACITQSATQPVVGIWTTASVPQARVLNPAASYTQPSYEGGAWTQVSRLGNPLVNEVVIGLPDKDKFNGSAPANDVANFANYVEYPTLPAVIDIVFGTDYQPTGASFPRTDLVAAFLTGLTIPAISGTGVTAPTPYNAFPTANNAIPAEYLHLNTNTEALVNTALAVTTVKVTAAGSQSRLGAAQCLAAGAFTKASLTSAGCDPFGYPNGRRLVDDVVDIALDAEEGYLINQSVNTTAVVPAYMGGGVFFTDGVDQSSTSTAVVSAANPGGIGAASKFLTVFPYLGVPTSGSFGNGS